MTTKNNQFIYPSEEVTGKFECYFYLDLPEEQQVWLFLHTGDGPRIVVHNYDNDGYQWLGQKTPFNVQFSRRGIKI